MANPEALAGPAKDSVMRLLNEMMYAGVSLFVIVIAASYFRAIMFIGKTINESKTEKEGHRDDD